MKTSTLRWTIAAAALMVAAGSASAQTYRAEIPMAFSAGGRVLAAGPYEISASGYATTKYQFYNRTDHSGVMLLGNALSDPPKQWRDEGVAKLTFECIDGSCRLKSLWNGTESFVQNFPGIKAPPTTLAGRHVETITLTMLKVR